MSEIDDKLVEQVMRAMEAYAATLPRTSDDAPFIRSHRKGLARAAIEAIPKTRGKITFEEARSLWCDFDSYDELADGLRDLGFEVEDMPPIPPGAPMAPLWTDSVTATLASHGERLAKQLLAGNILFKRLSRRD